MTNSIPNSVSFIRVSFLAEKGAKMWKWANTQVSAIDLAKKRIMFLAAVILILPLSVCAQGWTWKIEKIDDAGAFPSVVVDRNGGVHASYIKIGEGVKYAFRAPDSAKWFNLPIGAKAEEGFTRIAMDADGNPNICFTAYESLGYAQYKGGEWYQQKIAENFGVISYTCPLAIAPNGTKYLTWYQYMSRDRELFLHLRYASLQSGAWLAKTIDFEGETGKWNSLVLDPQGNPHIGYSAWRRGELRYASWNGKSWSFDIVDSRGRDDANAGPPCMAVSLALAADGTPMLSYFQDQTLKFARKQGNIWKKDSVDVLSPLASAGWVALHSSLVLDSTGAPHIIYGDFGSLKQAFWDGKGWRIQMIDSGGGGQYKHSSAAISPDGAIYVVFQDPADDSLKAAVGRLTTAQVAQGAKSDKP
jgi:hypothetical protein